MPEPAADAVVDVAVVSAAADTVFGCRRVAKSSHSSSAAASVEAAAEAATKLCKRRLATVVHFRCYERLKTTSVGYRVDL